MRPLWKPYLRSAQGILFVVDSSDKERMDEAKCELNKFVKSQNTQGLPCLVVANKQDLPEAMDVAEIEKLLGISDLSRAGQVKLVPACAVTGEGLGEAMDTMFDMVKKWKKGKSGRIAR